MNFEKVPSEIFFCDLKIKFNTHNKKGNKKKSLISCAIQISTQIMFVLYSFLATCLFSGAYVASKHLVAKPNHVSDNPRRHLYVLVAFFPLAFFMSLMLPHLTQFLVQYLIGHMNFFGSEGIYFKLVTGMRPASLIGAPSTTDLLSMILFWFATYSVMVVLRRLVDLSRVLKVSRKRLKELL